MRFARSVTAAAVAAAAVAGLTVGASGAGAAPTAPGFMKTSALPPLEGGTWRAGTVTPGMSDWEFCLKNAAMGGTPAWHREYYSDLDAEARQISFRLPDEAAARRAVTDLRLSVATCAGDWLNDNPGSSATWDDYGKVTVEEGARVYGVGVLPPEAGAGVHLFAVGRDGRTVTFVHWGRLGLLEDAPVAEFRDTTRAAVNALD